MTVDPERLKIARAKLETEPYNLDSWEVIARDGQLRKIDEARKIFEEVVDTFPTSGKFWKMFIEQEMKSRNYERVEKLFQRCLIKVLNIDLWRTYLQYVKETKASLPSYKEKMAQAYDFALDKMGLDILSFPIWNDYINFLKSVEAVGSYAENQKITAIRKVYQRGIINPMANIESLWKDYVSFEQGVNPIIAEKLTSERSRDYMTARRVAKEYEALTRGLNKTAPCIPPSGTGEELRQVELWQKYISWEKSNPLKVEDPLLISKRVMFAFEQCLLCLAHHPNIWYEAALFLQESSRILAEKGDVDSSKMLLEQAGTLYDRCTSGILSSCKLLHFAFADFEEQRRNNDKVREIYEKYLDQKDVDVTLCYIQFMKFCRRTEGATAARTVFKKARDDPRSEYHIFVAAALMEYYCTKDAKIAGNIFELGFKKFKNNPEYILEYLDFLSHLNETNNTRVLFERALTSGSLATEQSLKIWSKFLEFESNVGDLASIMKVEKRLGIALKETPDLECSETAQLIERYRFLELFPCTQDELRSMGYRLKDNRHGSLFSVMNPLLSSVSNGNSALPEEVSYPRPDFTQMIPFKPKVKWVPGEHKVPGGGFPMPPVAAELCQIMPPPESFNGPFVIIDRLIEVIAKTDMPSEYPAIPPGKRNGLSTELFDIAKSVDWTRSDSESGLVGKRKFGRKDSVGSDDDDSIVSAPANDIYRQRQQKKIR